MPYSNPPSLFGKIHQPIDSRRINGLIGEDRYRTCNRFVKGNVAERPTDAIDISAASDLLQGLPTHVKIKKIKTSENGRSHTSSLPYCKREGYDIDMADAYEFWKLVGDHRLTVMFYHMVERTDATTGQKFKVMEFVEIVEIIMTENAFKQMRGNVRSTEVGFIKTELLSWRGSYRTEDEAEKKAAIVRSSVDKKITDLNNRLPSNIIRLGRHVNVTQKKKTGMWGPSNKRVQPRLKLHEMVAFAEQDDIGFGRGKYRNIQHTGSKIEQMVTIYHANCQGILLPWMTKAKSATEPGEGWKKLKRKNEHQKAARTNRLVTLQEQMLNRLLSSAGAMVEYRVAGGALMVFSHVDPMQKDPTISQWRSIWLERESPEFERNVAWACRILSITYIPSVPCWFGTETNTRKLIDALTPRPLANLDNPLRHLVPVKNQPTRRTFETLYGKYLVEKTQNGKFYIAPESSGSTLRNILERRMSLAFHVHGLAGKPDSPIQGIPKWDKMVWYVEPKDLQSAIRAIINYKDLELAK